MEEKVLKIRVGDKEFITTKKTLEKARHFKKLFLNGKYDNIFVDRCELMFEIVLNFLRYDKVEWVDANNFEKWNSEIDFYGLKTSKLDIVYAICKQDIEKHDYSITYTNSKEKKYLKAVELSTYLLNGNFYHCATNKHTELKDKVQYTYEITIWYRLEDKNK